MTAPDQYASVRYLVDDVQAAIDFYTTHLGFTLNTSAAPAFADVVRGAARGFVCRPPPAPAPAPHRVTRRRGAAPASTSWSTTWTTRSPDSAGLACPSAATWSPAPGGAKSC